MNIRSHALGFNNMDADDLENLKDRQIFFDELHPDPNQAQTAALMLDGIPGIRSVRSETPILLRIRYNLLDISLEQIESALIETGFHLDNGLLFRLRRALYYYTEETQRANNGCDRGDSNCTRKIFIDQYQRRNHALKDPRPEHWRKYL